MKRVLIFLFISFILLVSSIFSAGLVLAEKKNNSESSVNSEKLEGKFNGSVASKTKIEVEKDEDGRRVVTKKIISVVDGVEIEKEIVTKSKGGKTIVEVKGEKKFFDFEGNERKIKVEIKEKNENGKIKKIFKAESDGQEVETELELNETHEGNMTKIKVRLKDGSNKEIKVLPEKASETAREKLRLKFGNESVVIKEIKHNNIPRVVYHIEGNQTGKFLGIFKTALRVQTDIDAETGDVVVTNGPWWSFLVSKDVEVETSILDKVIVPGNETINESIVNNNSLLSDEKRCLELGGRWQAGPMTSPPKYFCSLPTNDSGKDCTDSSECISYCQAPEGAKVRDNITGKCYSWSGGSPCETVIRNGTYIGDVCA